RIRTTTPRADTGRRTPATAGMAARKEVRDAGRGVPQPQRPAHARLTALWPSELLQAREDVLRESREALRRFLMRHEAGAAGEDEVLVGSHLLAVLLDLPVHRVGIAREHQPLR